MRAKRLPLCYFYNCRTTLCKNFIQVEVEFAVFNGNIFLFEFLIKLSVNIICYYETWWINENVYFNFKRKWKLIIYLYIRIYTSETFSLCSADIVRTITHPAALNDGCVSCCLGANSSSTLPHPPTHPPPLEVRRPRQEGRRRQSERMPAISEGMFGFCNSTLEMCDYKRDNFFNFLFCLDPAGWQSGPSSRPF